MAKSKTKRSRSADSQNIVGFVVDGCMGQMLSRRARRYAQRYPNQAAAAAAAAIEGAAAAADTPPDSAPPSVEDRDPLAEFIIDVPWEEAGLVNASEAAAMLGVNRKTVYDWIDKGRLLGWQTSRQRYAIPKEQIIAPERIVEGIPQLLEIIGDPELVWAFLSSAWPFEGNVARPIDKLRSGDIDAVLGAAPGYGFAPR